MSRTPQEKLQIQIDLALVTSMQNPELTRACAKWTHSQCEGAKVDRVEMLIALLDVAAVCMAHALDETPAERPCDVIDRFAFYFHARVHEEQDTIREANKK